MSNDGSMGTASIYYYSTSTIVIIWLEIGLRGRNAIWNFGMENCHLWAYSLPSLVDIISHHYQRSAVWMYPLVLYKEPVGRFFIVVCNGVDLGALWWWKQIWAEREWVFYVTSSWRHGVWTQIFLRIQHIIRCVWRIPCVSSFNWPTAIVVSAKKGSHHTSHARVSLPNLLPLHSHTSNAASTTPPQQLHRHDSHPIHPPNYPMTNPGAPYRFSSSSTIRHIGGFFVFIFFVLVFGPSCEWTSSQPIDSKPTNKKRFIQQPSTTITTSAVHNHN